MNGNLDRYLRQKAEIMSQTAYQQLCHHFKKIHNLSHVSSFAYWDQATQMPSGAGASRNEALSELATLIHQYQIDPKIEQWLNDAQKEAEKEPSSSMLSSVREMKRVYQMSTVLPEDLVKRQTQAKMTCGQGWRTQKKDNDWPGFAKNLKEVVALSREEAKIRSDASGLNAYDALVDKFDPGVTSERLDTLFGDLKTWLPGLIQAVLQEQSKLTVLPLPSPIPERHQHKLSKKIMELLGFDFAHGRLDVSAHPFCGGVPDDVRITTRYDEQDAVSSLMAVVHETGHALYEQGLPDAVCYLPVGKARSTAIHESQSLFFEMQLGRSKAFLKLITPYMSDMLDIAGNDPCLDLMNLHDLIQRVSLSYIRVEADEVTYPAHVMLRYDIERDLINGSIEVEHIPDYWEDAMQRYLGLSCNGDHAIGCMQDIHWSEGLFGYFPGYTLGAMYAAQLFAAMNEQYEGSVREDIACGDFSKIKGWLATHVWSKASYFETDELMTQATGSPLDSVYFRRHLENRYLGTSSV